MHRLATVALAALLTTVACGSATETVQPHVPPVPARWQQSATQGATRYLTSATPIPDAKLAASLSTGPSVFTPAATPPSVEEATAAARIAATSEELSGAAVAIQATFGAMTHVPAADGHPIDVAHAAVVVYRQRVTRNGPAGTSNPTTLGHAAVVVDLDAKRVGQVTLSAP